MAATTNLTPLMKPASAEWQCCGCSCRAQKVVGLISLVIAAILLIFAVIFVSGTFGGGKMGFIAGGLTVGSMIAFAIAAYLWTPKNVSTEFRSSV